MGTGPVEFAVIGFPGNKFTGEIAPALGELVDAGTIRILDLAFVTKDADGNAAAVEIEDTDSSIFQAFEQIGAERGGLLNAEDLDLGRRGPGTEQLGRDHRLGGPVGGQARRGAEARRRHRRRAPCRAV